MMSRSRSVSTLTGTTVGRRVRAKARPRGTVALLVPSSPRHRDDEEVRHDRAGDRRDGTPGTRARSAARPPPGAEPARRARAGRGRAAARGRAGPGGCVGARRRGGGLDTAVAGATVIVPLATSQRGDAAATARLVDA